jgi:hypothetical protein
MAFNANLPQANSPISSAELRDQLNALKQLIDQRPTMAEVTGNSAASIDITVGSLPMNFSNPPTYADVNAIGAKLNELIAKLKR